LLRSLLKWRGSRGVAEVEADFARLRRAYDVHWERGF
jgi:3-deoxy-D-manno-octulosonic acid kinase